MPNSPPSSPMSPARGSPSSALAAQARIEALALALDASEEQRDDDGDAELRVGCAGTGGWFSTTAEQDLQRLRRLGLFGLRAARGATNVAVRTAELGVMVL